MWRRVDIVLPDVSAERIASILRVEGNPQAKNQREQVQILLTLVLHLRVFFLLLA
jgi:hypothetical protein